MQKFIRLSLPLILILLTGLSRLPNRASLALVTAPLGCQELIGNGDFEAGVAAPWVEVPGGEFSIISEFITHHESKFAAWLGGDSLREDDLYQTITIPADVSSAELRYWWFVETIEEEPYLADFMTVTVRSASGAVLKTLETISNQSEAGLWVESRSDLRSYAGQTVRVGFHSTTDLANETSFFVDDVRLQACSDSNTSTATPTATSTPTSTPTDIPTATPTSTPSPTTKGFFLPLLARGI